MHPTIFLDVDGVLCLVGGALDGPATQALHRIVEATGAQIIVSSTWRESREGLTSLREHLEFFDLEIAGVTPLTSEAEAHYALARVPEPYVDRMTLVRGYEVFRWLIDRPADEMLAPFVILDDLAVPAGNHLVQTAYPDGLTEAHADRAIRVLQQPPPAPSDLTDRFPFAGFD